MAYIRHTEIVTDNEMPMNAPARPTRADLRRPPRQQVSVRLQPEIVRAVDGVARRTGRLRSEVIEDLLASGLRPDRAQIFD